MSTTPLEIIACRSQKEWARWLAAHHDKSHGVWLRFFKNGSKVPSVSYDEALDEALCHGWIDGQLKKYDADSFLRKFTPRRRNSTWSKRNVAHAVRLLEAGRMKSAGLREVEAARGDGRWMGAYDSPRESTMPPEFLEALKRNRKAHAFFLTLNKANQYAINWRLQTARTPETKARRQKAILAMLARRQAFHPQRGHAMRTRSS